MIYFIQAGETGAIKIGTCRDDQIDARVNALQTGNAHEFRLLGIMDGGITTEQVVHSKFYPLRQRGEWFSPAPELLKFIRVQSRGWQLKRKSLPDNAISIAIHRLGGPTRAAKTLGVSQPNISMWKQRNSIPADKVLAVEAATGISRHELRPDIFGKSESAA